MTVIGKYEVIGELGRGGMGRVYKARVPVVDEIVAIKVFSPIVVDQNEVPELRKRFIREAKLLYRIDHPHVVNIRDVDLWEAEPFYVMEYLPTNLLDEMGDGQLTRIRRKGPLPLDKALHYTGRILQALAYLHDRNIVHRDIKPANVLLDGSDKVKLADFGIARCTEGTVLTTTGTIMGSGQYAAPEQRDGKRVDHRADIYSVGMLMYYMLTGTFPSGFRPKEPGQLNPEVSSALNDAILKALQEDPNDRHQTAGQMMNALDQATKQENIDTTSHSSKSSAAPRYQLRSTPKTVTGDQFKKEFGLNDEWKPLLYIQNDYKDNGNSTITDRATGLMWQQSGSDERMTYDKTDSYIRALNQSRFAGYSDWRLPTIPELMSLLEPSVKNGDLYIDTVFDSKQYWCWSCDEEDSGSALLVFFNFGLVSLSLHAFVGYVRAVRSGQ